MEEEGDDTEHTPGPSKHNHLTEPASSESHEPNCEQPDERTLSPIVRQEREPVHVSVDRTEIAATRMTEGDDELQGLDVDVYDRQTYEKSVFDQVDRVITQVATQPAQSKSATSIGEDAINDLMRVIHDQSETDDQEIPQQDYGLRDVHILNLARQERLNRVTIKRERLEQEVVDQQLDFISNLPRIPRRPLDPRQSRHDSRPVKIEPGGECIDISSDEDGKDDDVESASPGSSAPSRLIKNDNTEDDSDELEYQTDPPSDSEEEESTPREPRLKKITDDGDFKIYSRRVKEYMRERAKIRLANISEDGIETKKLDETITIDGDLRILKDVWENLYEHQKTGVRWLWELHQLGTGGILGDEMGLGKTVQMIAFLIALKCSDVTSAHSDFDGLGPVVLVCPATVMHQWLMELRKWYPPFRVAILHSTGTFSGDRRQLVKVIYKTNGILICSFPGVVIYQDELHAYNWHYAILDEGHKIRNPDAQVTLACKRFRTPHRLILSGSPVQNNLKELWSIFDFIYPGKLGTLPVFMTQFGIPITQGGYANASDMQVQIAYKCACVLRDAIKPFLLRRTKAEVNSKLKLPDRSEQVLFCKLTEKQRKVYEDYLKSPTVRDIKRGTCQIFVGLIQLRKICNHPDLFDATECTRQMKQKQQHEERKIKHLEFFATDETYGHYQKSGKMMVVDALLKLWKKQNHKVLLFTQSRQMLKMFENYVKDLNYKYLTMDGSTPIGLRHSLIDKFNTTDDIFIFLLTTRVGGVGVNLIGANRIIIYDPDWNPSTDIQARERAWRIGQQRHVVIYRLLTAGTIEEKIYHRQVFKLYLTNRILRDAKQKRFFKTNDMHELFTLGRDDKNIETKALFDDDLQISEKSIKSSKSKDLVKKHKKRKISVESITTPVLSEAKLREMRERAKILSQMIASKYGNTPIDTSGVKKEPSQSQLHFQGDTSTNEPSSICLDEMSPTQPVPYCPAWQVEGTHPVVLTAKQRPAPTKQKVDYLVRQDIYKPDCGSKNVDRSEYQSDDYILGRLFKKANISGALKHDRIETDCTADYKVVESEAEKVARDAIRVLRESRRMCSTSTSGIPNWTGKNGQLASERRLIPKNKARAGLGIRPLGQSSSKEGEDSLLTSIRRRNHINPVPLRPSHDNDDESEEERDKDFAGRAQDQGAENMADKIREFVLYQSSGRGETDTEQLLEFFKKSFRPDQTALFKAILHKMCDMRRRGDKGFWRLKSEFCDL